MHHTPKHVLVGQKDSYSLLEDAVNYIPHHCGWIVPKFSKQGDTVVILIGKELVGEAVIREDAKTTGVKGEYASTIGAVKLWEPRISVEEIERLLPQWGYLTYNRTYAYVPPEHQEPLLTAINQVMDRQSDEEEERFQKNIQGQLQKLRASKGEAASAGE